MDYLSFLWRNMPIASKSYGHEAFDKGYKFYKSKFFEFSEDPLDEGNVFDIGKIRFSIIANNWHSGHCLQDCLDYLNIPQGFGAGALQETLVEMIAEHTPIINIFKIDDWYVVRRTKKVDDGIYILIMDEHAVIARVESQGDVLESFYSSSLYERAKMNDPTKMVQGSKILKIRETAKVYPRIWDLPGNYLQYFKSDGSFTKEGFDLYTKMFLKPASVPKKKEVVVKKEEVFIPRGRPTHSVEAWQAAMWKDLGVTNELAPETYAKARKEAAERRYKEKIQIQRFKLNDEFENIWSKKLIKLSEEATRIEAESYNLLLAHNLFQIKYHTNPERQLVRLSTYQPLTTLEDVLEAPAMNNCFKVACLKEDVQVSPYTYGIVRRAFERDVIKKVQFIKYFHHLNTMSWLNAKKFTDLHLQSIYIHVLNVNPSAIKFGVKDGTILRHSDFIAFKGEILMINSQQVRIKNSDKLINLAPEPEEADIWISEEILPKCQTRYDYVKYSYFDPYTLCLTFLLKYLSMPFSYYLNKRSDIGDLVQIAPNHRTYIVLEVLNQCNFTEKQNFFKMSDIWSIMLAYSFLQFKTFRPGIKKMLQGVSDYHLSDFSTMNYNSKAAKIWIELQRNSEFLNLDFSSDKNYVKVYNYRECLDRYRTKEEKDLIKASYVEESLIRVSKSFGSGWKTRPYEI